MNSMLSNSFQFSNNPSFSLNPNTMRLFSILILLFLFSRCQQPAGAEQEPPSGMEAHLGEVDFLVNGTAEARRSFKEGLLLLHSFEYEDARDLFQRAREADKGCVMAYWGEAMTHNQPLWRRQQMDKAREVLLQLGESREDRLQQAEEGIEREFLSAVDVLYFSEGDKNDRDVAYAEVMEKMYRKYPGNHEVAAFYALSLIGAVPVGRDEEAYQKSATISEGIMAENPNHPGALHYLIHAYDDPGHAHLARKAADSYADVAPDAAHALHMPSHIFVAMGMWHEVVASNIESWEASVNRMEDKGLSGGAKSYHAYNWLQYGLLQQGHAEKGREMLQKMVEFTAEDPTKSARAYLVDMKGGYLVESDEWDGPETEIEVDVEDLNVVHKAVYAFLDGMKAYRAGLAAGVETALRTVEAEIDNAALMVTDEGLPMCAPSGASGYAPNQQDLNKAQVISFELGALLADLNGEKARAEKLFSEAVALEEQSTFAYGPPPIVYPSFELYAEWLLKAGRPGDALRQLEVALRRGPGRRKALVAQIQAATMLKETQLIKDAQEQLEEISRLSEAHSIDDEGIIVQ